MIETGIKIFISRKSDIDAIKQSIIDNNTQHPVYIFEHKSHYEIEFVSDYEEWELDSIILSRFPEYEFVRDLENGRKEIRLQLTRYQSEHSIDGWGRPIQNPLNETKYLIKKSEKVSEKVSAKSNPRLKVLFEGHEQDYFINIVEGINTSTGEKGFLLLNDFKTNNEKGEATILKDRLYKTSAEAFSFGYYKLQDVVSKDFRNYIQEKKQKIREVNKVPRKIVRDFINSCNKFEIDEILKPLDSLIIFEQRFQRKTTIRTEGIEQFKEYLKSSNQDLCSKKFKIRSSWNIYLPTISIGVNSILNLLWVKQAVIPFKNIGNLVLLSITTRLSIY